MIDDRVMRWILPGLLLLWWRRREIQALEERRP